MQKLTNQRKKTIFTTNKHYSHNTSPLKLNKAAFFCHIHEHLLNFINTYVQYDKYPDIKYSKKCKSKLWKVHLE